MARKSHFFVSFDVHFCSAASLACSAFLGNMIYRHNCSVKLTSGSQPFMIHGPAKQESLFRGPVHYLPHTV
jgi:hypothetical protein